MGEAEIYEHMTWEPLLVGEVPHTNYGDTRIAAPDKILFMEWNVPRQ
jgi:hypothetical protein